MENRNNLTDKMYWKARQINLPRVSNIDKLRMELDWSKELISFIEQKANGTYLEIGCSPGYSTIAATYGVKFKKIIGIDYSSESDFFLINTKNYGIEANLINQDIFEYENNEKFDIVASYGLIEHFEDPCLIIQKHIDFLKRDGHLIIVIPHFRKIQYLYHFIFDTSDLKRHNISIMKTNFFETVAEKFNLEVCYLEYYGKLKFWNVDLEGSFIGNLFRRVTSALVRRFAKCLGNYLPDKSKFYSPWIIFVARKKEVE